MTLSFVLLGDMDFQSRHKGCVWFASTIQESPCTQTKININTLSLKMLPYAPKITMTMPQVWYIPEKGVLWLPAYGYYPKFASLEVLIVSLTPARMKAWTQGEEEFDTLVSAVVEKWLEIWPEIAPVSDGPRETAKEYQARKVERTKGMQCKLVSDLLEVTTRQLEETMLKPDTNASNKMAELTRVKYRSKSNYPASGQWKILARRIVKVRSKMGLVEEDKKNVEAVNWKVEMERAMQESGFETFTQYNPPLLDQTGSVGEVFARRDNYMTALERWQ
ncbi:hypothetical protein L218DRAFT_948389 [Marasmius fiardii PR-910]|nr:hypothetical protein L218DRAFT_948389 [Marasmius fiardii PR-910]